MAIVVALRWADVPNGEGVAVRDIAEGVRAAMERASVGGAHLVGAVSDGATFGFDDDGLEEALDLAIALVKPKTAEVPARWKCGVAGGALETTREEGSFLRLSVGPAMSRAAVLSRAARAGEVVVDVMLPQAAAGSVLAVGRRVASDASKKRIRGLVLDLHEPWRRDGGEAVERLREPRLVAREKALEAIKAAQPGGIAVVRAAPGFGGSRFLDEIVARTARALLVSPVGCSVEPLGALRVAVVRGLERHRRRKAAGQSIPPLSARAADGTQRLREGQGVDVDGASEVASEWLTPEPHEAETPLLLIDDAMAVDRATLEAIGLAAAAAGAPFAVVARIDVSEPVPQPLQGLVVEAEVKLEALTPHQSIEVLDDACGGAAAVHPEVRKRWTRRGGGIPLGIVEALRHGLAVGELAVREGLISPRGRTSGRGRMLSPHGWVSRRLAALAKDRPHDATITTLVALSGGGLPLARLDEMAAELSLPTGEALDLGVARLSREGLLQIVGDRVSTATRTVRDAAIDRTDEATRMRLHKAIAGAIARTATGLDLAEGSHHAALAGDHLEAAALALRAAERARGVGLSEWAEALASFARAEGEDLASEAPATTPSPAPKPSMASPKPAPAVPTKTEARVRNPDATEEDVEPIDLSAIAADIAPELAPALPQPRAPSPAPPPPANARAKPPTFPPGKPPRPPAAPPRPSRDAPALSNRPSEPVPLVPEAPLPLVALKPAPGRVGAAANKPALQKPALQRPVSAPQKIAASLGSPRIAVADVTPPSLGMSTLRTGEIAALPPPSAANIPAAAAATTSARKPPGPPPRATGTTDILPAVDVDATEEIAPIEISMQELEPLAEDEVESSEPSAGPKSDLPAVDLLREAKAALLARDLPTLDRLLADLHAKGVKGAAVDRMRGIAAVARGDLGVGLQLLRQARAEATDDRAVARAAVAYSIALGAAGHREDAIIEALEALSVEKRIDAKGRGPVACRKLIERLLQ